MSLRFRTGLRRTRKMRIWWSFDGFGRQRLAPALSQLVWCEAQRHADSCHNTSREKNVKQTNKARQRLESTFTTLLLSWTGSPTEAGPQTLCHPGESAQQPTCAGQMLKGRTDVKGLHEHLGVHGWPGNVQVSPVNTLTNKLLKECCCCACSSIASRS